MDRAGFTGYVEHMDKVVLHGETPGSRWAAGSATGGCRVESEDAFGVSDDGSVFVVADGCGGRSSGRRASDLAVRCILASEHDPDDQAVAVADPLAARVLEANDVVFRAARQDPALVGIGCALAALSLGKGHVAIMHVGDCRVGRLGAPFVQRAGGDDLPELRWLTLDHVLWVDALLAGRPLAEVEELRSVHGNVIMRAVGVTDSLDVEVQYRTSQRGDLFLLCTDGLSAYVPHETITGILRSPAGLAERCAALLDAAEAAGGYDNATVILVEAAGVVSMHGHSLTK